MTVCHLEVHYLLQMSLQYGELRPINGWDRLAGLGYPIIFPPSIASWQSYCTALYTVSHKRVPPYPWL